MAPLLTADQIQLIYKYFDEEDEKWFRYWDEDVLFLAERFKRAEGQDRQLAWHHLLLAVGNFKRQAGMIYPPELAPVSPTVAEDNDDRVAIPRSDGQGTWDLHVDEEKEWEALTDLPAGAQRVKKVKGLGVATATTLLSAIFPGQHMIMDRLAGCAAAAILAMQQRPVVDETQPLKKIDVVTWTDYQGWYRPEVLRTKEHEYSKDDAQGVVRIERALYKLGQRVAKDLNGDGREWRDYVEGTRHELDRVP